MNIKNLFISFGFFVMFLIGLLLIFSTLNYYSIINDKVFNIIKIMIPILSLFIGSFLLGKKAIQKGWLEGLKLGSIVISIMFILSIIFIQNYFSLKSIIYYIILFITSIISSMIGINFKKIDNK